MNRLPCCDRTTHRSELVVFTSLGLAGVFMVALAVNQMSQFVAGSERLAATLADRTAPLAVTTPPNTHRVATNLNGAPPARAATRPLGNGKIRSAGEAAVGLLLR